MQNTTDKNRYLSIKLNRSGINDPITLYALTVDKKQYLHDLNNTMIGNSAIY